MCIPKESFRMPPSYWWPPRDVLDKQPPGKVQLYCLLYVCFVCLPLSICQTWWRADSWAIKKLQIKSLCSHLDGLHFQIVITYKRLRRDCDLKHMFTTFNQITVFPGKNRGGREANKFSVSGWGFFFFSFWNKVKCSKCHINYLKYSET